MLRGLLILISVAVFATGALAQGVQLPVQNVPKKIDQMSMEELTAMLGQVEAAAIQLEAVTKSVVNLIDTLRANLRGKRAVAIEDNNKMMKELRLQMDTINAQIQKLVKEKKEKEAKKNGNRKR